MKYLALTGRILFSLIFLTAFMGHFTQGYIDYAASKDIPLPAILVPLSGVIAMVGALNIISGYKAKFGAWLLVIFLVPVTFMMHNFWTVEDQMQQQNQMAHFMKNISMLGAALFIAYMGPGPLSAANNKVNN